MSDEGVIIGAVLVFILGVAAGVVVPYLFNLIAMVLRHCGGM